MSLVKRAFRFILKSGPEVDSCPVPELQQHPTPSTHVILDQKTSGRTRPNNNTEERPSEGRNVQQNGGTSIIESVSSVVSSIWLNLVLIWRQHVFMLDFHFSVLSLFMKAPCHWFSSCANLLNLKDVRVGIHPADQSADQSKHQYYCLGFKGHVISTKWQNTDPLDRQTPYTDVKNKKLGGCFDSCRFLRTKL